MTATQRDTVRRTEFSILDGPAGLWPGLDSAGPQHWPVGIVGDVRARQGRGHSQSSRENSARRAENILRRRCDPPRWMLLVRAQGIFP